jgi:malonyl-CoA O-methyltransferase
VNRFPDMHDIGDGLVRAGLADPVLDVDRLSVSYDSADKLFTDLTLAGARNALVGRGRGLLGRARFNALKQALATPGSDGKILLDLELVYGHCWGAGRRNDPGNYAIDANRIPLRR